MPQHHYHPPHPNDHPLEIFCTKVNPVVSAAHPSIINKNNYPTDNLSLPDRPSSHNVHRIIPFGFHPSPKTLRLCCGCHPFTLSHPQHTLHVVRSHRICISAERTSISIAPRKSSIIAAGDSSSSFLFILLTS